MNRDEQRSRPKAHPPGIHVVSGGTALFPYESSGGTWIGVNDRGVAFALINWYAVQGHPRKESVSRGTIIPAILPFTTAEKVGQALVRQPLEKVRPFRLIAVFPGGRLVVEWRWNQEALKSFRYEWKLSAWFSSGFDEPGAQLQRGQHLSRFMPPARAPNDTLWLRRLHASHSPGPGPFSFCVHREDAATVSYSEIAVLADQARMHYLAGNPCCSNSVPGTVLFPLRPGGSG